MISTGVRILILLKGKQFLTRFRFFQHYSSLLNFSRETYNTLTTWLTDARTLASPNIVIILLGNKKDLDADREVTFLEASRFAQENGRFIHVEKLT